MILTSVTKFMAENMPLKLLSCFIYFKILLTPLGVMTGEGKKNVR